MHAPSELVHRTVLGVQALKEERWKWTAAAANVSIVLTHVTILFVCIDWAKQLHRNVWAQVDLVRPRKTRTSTRYTRAHVVYLPNVVAEQVT